MPSSAVLSAALLLLRALRDPTLPARHRILSFLCDVPHKLENVSEGVREFLQILSDECNLSEEEKATAVSAVLSVTSSIAQHGDHFQVSNIAQQLRKAVRDDGNSAPRQGEAVLAEGGADGIHLVDAVIAVEPSSSAGLFLRRVAIELEANAFEGLAAVAHMWRETHDELSVWLSKGLPRVPVGPAQLPTPEGASLLSASRLLYGESIERGDLPSSVHALHALYDTAYGTRLMGGSGVNGPTTPLALMTGDGTASAATLGTGPSSRVHELLASSISPAPVGGTTLGRSLLHYGLLAHAALHISVGAWDEAEDALAECTRVAQTCGDAAAAAYALLMGADVKMGRARALADGAGHWAGMSGQWRERQPAAAAYMDSEAADMLRRALHRSGELGLWRQQCRAAIALVEGTVLAAAASSSSSLSHTALSGTGTGMGDGANDGQDATAQMNASVPLSMPDWLSVDPFTSCRPGGYGLGGLSATNAVLGGAGGAGAGAVSGGLVAALSPTLTSMGSGAHRDGLGAALLTALTGPTVCAEVALHRRYRALQERRPSLGGSTNPFAAAEGSSSMPGGTPGAGSAWSVPLPLSWNEVVASQAEGHASRARMWAGLGRLEGGQGQGQGAIPTLTAVLLADAADACAAAASIPASAGSRTGLDLEALLDSIGCMPRATLVA